MTDKNIRICFIDTEFDGFNGPLISIGLCDLEDNRFYAELMSAEDIKNPWVQEHVVPHLDGTLVAPREVVVEELVKWLGEDVVIFADWPDDIRHLMELFITGPGQSVCPELLMTLIDRNLSSDASHTPHHALADAMAIRESYAQTLME